jgi:hypothetical protein
MIYMVPSPTTDEPEHKVLLKHRDEHGSVNFTSFKPTSRYPVALSIKSKELHGEDPVGPVVHLAAWQSAQWYFLEKTAVDNAHNLGFLPGIIIEGHECKFVATTWKNGRTVRAMAYLMPRHRSSNIHNRLFFQAFHWARLLRK